MRAAFIVFSILGTVSLVASCAPKPDPIIPDPIYDKFGHLEAVCVSDNDIRDPNSTLPPLPRCEERCDPGEQPTFTAPGQWPICTRIPEDNDDPGEQPDPQRRTIN